MNARRFVKGVGGFFDVFGSAVAVSAAVRERRNANEADLLRLGINPDQFRQIKRY